MGSPLKAGILALAALSAPARAQEAEAIDPQAIAVPALAAPESELGDARKYFVFHREGVGYDEALEDFGECLRQVPHGANRATPDFVPWEETPGVLERQGISPYGLVGEAILAIISGPLERSIRQLAMIRCMGPRGYRRYRVTEDTWKAIHEIEPARALVLQARIASGAKPPTPEAQP